MSKSSRERADELLREADELSQAGKHFEARERLEAVLDLSDTAPHQHGWALHALAHSYINSGEPARANEWFEEIIDLPTAPPVCLCEAYVARGYRLLSAKDVGGALAAFHSANAIGSGNPSNRASAQFHIAKCLLEQGDKPGALAALHSFMGMSEQFPAELHEAIGLIEQLGTAG